LLVTREEIVESLAADDRIVFLDPPDLDAALLGWTYDPAGGADGPRAVYSLDALAEVFSSMNGWTEDESWEWIDFNVLGLRGPDMPLYVSVPFGLLTN
jgi:hypothetical protein